MAYDFHIQAMDEMLRVCKEIRIFPLVGLNADSSDMISAVIAHYREKHNAKLLKTDYEYQKGANKMLMIRK